MFSTVTNFDYLKQEPKFNSFADVAITAEKCLKLDRETCVINCRRAMEFAIKWMYSVDEALHLPYQDTLVTLMNTEEFHDIVDDDLWKRLELIRKMGNRAAHVGKKITEDEAILCLQNLFIFMDFIVYCYSDSYEERHFDVALLKEEDTAPEAIAEISDEAVNLQDLIRENEALKKELTARREKQEETYTPKPLELSEYKTRKIYIDTMLSDAGWTEGRDWLNEVELHGMPNDSGLGFADYVLYDNAHKPLAIIEAKKTCKDVAIGRQQAKLYADILEKQCNRRPVVFLTNGFETRIIDNQYPERRVATIYARKDLEKFFNLKTTRQDLSNVATDEKIINRYYQKEAVKAVCEGFDIKNRRKALLVMATGSGKTRTVIAICKALLDKGWVKNILFLADRNALVTQAKRSFVNLLPDLSCSNIAEEKDNYTARCIFSTYQTMMNCIDSVRDKGNKLFTSGHFDLVICDEAHRSIYNKYRDIFNYFDGLLIGLTATPKDEIDKNTYQIFELENGVPTYGYDLAQAVADGFLVDFMSIETELKFIEQGIVYDDLSEEEKRIYEETFKDENGEVPDRIAPSALNEWVFNDNTIRGTLRILMNDGLKIDYGSKIGKTIIFAKSHAHAEKILEIFGKEYPHLTGYAKVIDNYTTYAQSAIDEFSEAKKLPQIAISVDMLDTGIDVPEVLNLVFFKKVFSKAKFWQMIGRGTRLCKGLIDGADKTKFYIFDFCGNFEFFRMNKGKATANSIPIQCAIFALEFEIVYMLQKADYHTEELIAFRKALVEKLVSKVKALNRENFAVKQHLKFVDIYSDETNYNQLTFEDTLNVKDELAPLIEPESDEPTALRFDALMYGIELAYLAGKKYSRARRDLMKKVVAISEVANIPEIMIQSELIDKILHTDYVSTAGINEFEHIRENLRDLMKYIPNDQARYDTNFEDEILSIEWKESELENDDLKITRRKLSIMSVNIRITL